MQCDICNDGRDYKNIKMHKRMKHPETEEPELTVAKLLHEEITSILGEEHGFEVQEWGSFDPNPYLAVVRKIKKALGVK